MTRPQPRLSTLAVTVALLALPPFACSRTIEEEEPVLVESRIEPCQMWCTNQLDPECGAILEDQAWRSVDDCVESCAGLGGGWDWALQPDGTDACAEEWIAAAECIDALTCEGRRAWFRRPGLTTDYACYEEFAEKRHCFNSTPSLEKVED